MIDIFGRARATRSFPRAANCGSRMHRTAQLSLLALVLVAPAPALAQAPGALPDTTPLPIVSDSAPAYLSKIGRLDNAVQMGDSRHQILLAAAPTATQLDADLDRGALIDACPSGPSPGAGPARADRLVARNAADLLVIVATGTPEGNTLCEWRWNSTQAAVWRSLFYADSIRQRSSPIALQLEVDGRPVAPVSYVSRPAYEWNNGAWVRAGSQLRYYYDMQLLRRRPDGGVPKLRVLVWGNGIVSPSSFALLETRLDHLGDEYLAWRFATLDERTGLRSQLQPRRAVGSELSAALKEAHDNRIVSGALDASMHLALSSAGSPYERMVARAIVSDAAYQLGDSLQARALVARIHQEAPCLQLPSGAVRALQTFAESLPHRGCEIRPLGRIALAGLIVPGGSHYATGSRLYGSIVTGIVGSLAAGALVRERTARDHYARYESATTIQSAYQWYTSAVELRQHARSAAVSAGVAWVADAVLTTALAQYHNMKVARDRL